MKFSTFLVFILLWATVVYDPIAHWVWGTGGWLHKLGALDFAGGTVVHISSGVSALAAALVLGRRLGYGREPMEPHNIPFVVLGAALLWFGWFGFNAGSAVSSGSLATSAFVVTNTAAAMAALAWMFMSWIFHGRPSVLGAASGAVAGLVAITPASGFVTPLAALAIGAGAGVFCFLAVRLRSKVNVDDSLDVWACHGIGGTWGALATGLFATVAVNSGGANGVFYGNPRQFLIQLVTVAVVWAYAFVATWAILKVLYGLMGLRLKAGEEVAGLDLSLHGEEAYRL
jgi:Amt family ammonium transporter